MVLEGTVTNVTAFGAFVDVGVHQDGLVHVSQLADRFVKDPREVVKAGDVVKVTVVEVDPKRRRIALTMRKDGGAGSSRPGSPGKGSRDDSGPGRGGRPPQPPRGGRDPSPTGGGGALAEKLAAAWKGRPR
jgi:uncharacterized protein